MHWLHGEVDSKPRAEDQSSDLVLAAKADCNWKLDPDTQIGHMTTPRKASAFKISENNAGANDQSLVLKTSLELGPCSFE